MFASFLSILHCALCVDSVCLACGCGVPLPAAPVVRAGPVRSCGWLLNSVACNSPINLSGIEIGMLQFQRFGALLQAGSGNCMRLLCGARPLALRGGRLVCAWALLLVALTRSCAAGPYRWSMGGPAHAPPIGLTCAVKGPRYPPVRPMVPPLEPMRPPLN